MRFLESHAKTFSLDGRIHTFGPVTEKARVPIVLLQSVTEALDMFPLSFPPV